MAKGLHIATHKNNLMYNFSVMSSSLSGPEFGGAPISENALRQQRIYYNYFNGLILGDAEDLSFVGNELDGSTGYLPEMVHSHTLNLKQMIIANGGHFEDEVIEDALRDGIRAFEYSDAPFSARLVLCAVQRFDFDSLWLRETVRPSRWVLSNMVGATTKQEYQTYRRKGRQAMGALGLHGFFRRKRSF